MGVFNQENIILGGDPTMRSFAFAYGYGERSLIHPNLSNFVNPIVRAVAKVLSPFFPDQPMKALLMQVALWVSPVCASLAAYMVYLIALASGVRVVPSLALSVIYAFSISTLAYGSIPDHFLISSFLLATGLYLLLVNASLSDRNNAIAWTLLMTATVGITSSNLVPMLGMFTLSEYFRRPRQFKALVFSAGFMCVRAGILTLILWAGLNWIYQDMTAVNPDVAYNKHIGRVILHISNNPLRDVISFPGTVGQAFWGGTPDIEQDIPSLELFKFARYSSSFVYNTPFMNFKLVSLLWLIPIIVLGYSLFIGLTRQSGKFKPLAMAVALVIAFNWLLHTFWGNEVFLFSPHWHFATVVGLIPLIRFLPGNRITDFAIVLFAAVLVVLNLWVWSDILQQIPMLPLLPS